MNRAEATCWEQMLDIYRCFMTGEGERQDSYLDPAVTLWDAFQQPLAIGLEGLAALRANRDPGDERPVELLTESPVMSQHGDTVVGRHVLVVRYASGNEERMRVTCIWQRIADGWRIVHSHEDLVAAADG